MIIYIFCNNQPTVRGFVKYLSIVARAGVAMEMGSSWVIFFSSVNILLQNTNGEGKGATVSLKKYKIWV